MNWLINTRLLSNPANWFSIAAMLLLCFAGFVAIRSRMTPSQSMAVDATDTTATALSTE